MADADPNRRVQELRGILNNVKEELSALSLKIHDNPEIAFKETRSSELVRKFLEAKGARVINSRDPALNTAFVADFEAPEGTTGHRVIGVCSEYDALPDIGHACGHNLIAVAGAATAYVLHKFCSKHSLPVKVRLLGTPAEEKTGGKVFMLRAGDFDGIDLAVMAHPGNENLSFPNFMALASFKVHFYGVASHAAGAPWDGVNALDAAVTAYNSIAMLRQQCKPDARIHGIFVDGGSAPNIIPEHTSMYFYVRANETPDMQTLLSKVKRCCECAAESSGCTVKFEDDPELKSTKQEPRLGMLWRKWMIAQGNHFRNDSLDKLEHVPLLKLDEGAVPRGSTDMGNILWAYPGIHPMYDIFPESTSREGTNLHTVKFRDAARTPYAFERTLDTSIALAMSVLEFFDL